MKPTDKVAFSKLMVSVSIIYDKHIDKVFIQLYWDALKHFSLDDLECAFYLHLKDPDVGRYFPKPADISQILLGTRESCAGVAWQKVEEEIARTGSYGAPQFDDPLLTEIIRSMGGWRTLCHSKSYEIARKSTQFQQLYVRKLKTKYHEDLLERRKDRVEALTLDALQEETSEHAQH